MVIHNAMEGFYYYFDCNLDLVSSDEIKRIVSEEKYNSGFYELCLKYSDIGINAPKTKDNESGQVVSCFQLSDMNSAISETFRYIMDHNIKNVSEFLSSIKIVYKFANRDKEDKATSALVSPLNEDMGRVQIYYNFSNLPDDIWEKLKTDITAKLSNN